MRSSAAVEPQALAADPWGNRLLAALLPDEWHRLQRLLEPVDMPMGHVLCDSGQRPTYAYFPTTAIVSLVYIIERGASAQIAVVGNEGVVGIQLFMGDGASPSRAVIQSGGAGYRLPAPAIREEFARAGSLMKMLLRYTQALMAQTAQTAVCNRHHKVEQQLCRWLLCSLDRQQGSELDVTHELISNLLGVRREGVTEAALALQRAGLISCRRGHISVLDRPGLEAHSCECYAAVTGEYRRLLPTVRLSLC